MKPISSGSASQSPYLIELTAVLAAAYVSQNSVAAADLPMMIKCIHAALSALQEGTGPGSTHAIRSSADIAVSIKDDHLVSFIDGKSYKSLKRHLTAHGMTPDQYRRRYGLPADYPLVSHGYAKVRSLIAKRAYYGNKVA